MGTKGHVSASRRSKVWSVDRHHAALTPCSGREPRPCFAPLRRHALPQPVPAGRCGMHARSMLISRHVTGTHFNVSEPMTAKSKNAPS